MSILQPRGAEESTPGCRQVAEAAERAQILELTTLLKQPHLAPFPWAETTPSQPEKLWQTKGEAAPETKSYASLIIEGLPALPSPPSPASPPLAQKGS